MNNLTIMKMPDGGYLVTDSWHDIGLASSPRFASTTIDEALRFIKQQLEKKQAVKS